jgi:hypothetical protein
VWDDEISNFPQVVILLMLSHLFLCLCLLKTMMSQICLDLHVSIVLYTKTRRI